MSRRTDSQRRRVYDWEERIVAPRDQSVIPFATAQGMIDAIWRELGLAYPPKALPLPPQARGTLGRATRLSIELGPSVPSWVLLHELAHALSSDHDGNSDGHGPIFLGLYVHLLERYLRLPKDLLSCSLREAGLRVAADSRPVFLDHDEV